MTALAALWFFAYFGTKQQCFEEQVRNKVLGEREAIAKRILFQVWSKYALDTEGNYIDKTEMLQSVIAALTILGCNDLPEKKESKEESPVS